MVSRFFPIVVCLFVLAGCGSQTDRPEIGLVSGVVTLDGEPLPEAGVLFSMPGFRASRGLTDGSGQYELTYLRDIKGAVVGEHTVTINRYAGEGQRAKPLPARYNTETTLIFDVQSGSNVADFDLESGK